MVHESRCPEFDRAFDALLAGSDEVSIARIRRMAGGGDGHADAVLGVCYEFGVNGIAQDTNLALTHYRKAIEKSRSLEGWLGVARLGLKSANGPDDVRASEDIYRYHAEAAERAEPWMALGRIALYGLSGSVDLVAAADHFKRASGFGEPLALTGLALVAWRNGKYLESVRLRIRAVRALLGRDLGSKTRN